MSGLPGAGAPEAQVGPPWRRAVRGIITLLGCPPRATVGRFFRSPTIRLRGSVGRVSSARLGSDRLGAGRPQAVESNRERPSVGRRGSDALQSSGVRSLGQRHVLENALQILGLVPGPRYSTGLIILWSLVQVQHGLPIQGFKILALMAACRCFWRVGLPSRLALPLEVYPEAA